MKTIITKPFSLYIITALLTLLQSSELFAQTNYSWTYDSTQSGTTGGSGIWSGPGTNWWDGSSVIAAGSSTTDVFGGTGNATLNFTGAGTIIKEGASYFRSAASAQHTLNFAAGSNYTLLGSADGSAQIGDGHMIYNIASTGTLTIGGNGNRILIRATTNVTAGPGLVFQGGGLIRLAAGTLLRNESSNSRLTVRGGARMDFGAGSLYTGVGGDFMIAPADFSRVYIDDGAITVNGGSIISGYSSANNTSRAMGIAIGTGTTGDGGILTINNGMVTAIGDPRYNSTTSAGVVIGGAATSTGGVLNLNGGTLIVSHIRSAGSTPTAIVNLNGGLIIVSTSINPGETSAITTDANLQMRLDRFLHGFGDTATNHVNIDVGGAFFDTSQIDMERTNGIATIYSKMRGVGSLTKMGGNALALGATNSYTGATFVNGGTLRLIVANAIATSGSVTVANGATLDFSDVDADSHAQVIKHISGAGFIKTGTATLTASNVADTTFTGNITGSGALEKTGAGSLTLTGVNSFSHISVTDGVIIGNSASLPTDIDVATSVVFNQTANGSYSGVISGAGLFEKSGAGTLVMNTASTHTGTATIRAGTLAAGAADVFATSAAVGISSGAAFDAASHNQTFANLTGGGGIQLGSANLALANTDDTTFSGTIIGTGTLTKTGAGALTLRGANTLGGIVIDAGTLRASAGALSGDVTNNASLVLDQQTAASLAARFFGAGSFQKTGAGIVTLTNDSSAYTGAMSIDAGGLMLGGGAAALGGNITVAGNALFGGAGSASGNIIMLSGAKLIVGADGGLAPETLVIGGTLSIDTTTIRFDLFSTNRSDTLRVGAGSLVVTGSNTIDIGLFTSGTFTLGENLGSLESLRLTVNGFEIGASARQSGTLANIGGTLQLIADADSSRALTWTGASGTATWNPALANWDGVTSGLFASSDKVIFDGISDSGGMRVIKIEGTGVVVSDMVVTGAADYVFAGAGIVSEAVINGDVLTGATGKLIKDGAGTLTFNNGANNFKGGVDLLGGVIALGTNATLGTGTLSFLGENTTLRADGEGVILGGAVNAAAAAIFDTQAHVMALVGTISGTAMLTKNGSGALVLSASNSHAGFKLAEGALALANNAALGQSLLVTGSGVAVQAAADALDIASRMDLGEHGLIFDTQEYNTTLSGSLAGAGLLIKTGSGALTLASVNNHGGVALAQGTVAIADSRALGAGLVATGSGATLRMAADNLTVSSAINTGTVGLKVDTGAHAATVSGEIGGAGALTKTGTAALTLSGLNAVGAIELAEGGLRVTRGEALGSGAVRLADDTVLELSGVNGSILNAITRADGAQNGGVVEFTNHSNIGIASSIRAREIVIKGGSRVAARHAGALGGSALTPVRVDAGSSLVAGAAGLLAGDIFVDGGALLFDAGSSLTARRVAFSNGATVGLGAAVPSGEYVFLATTGGITGPLIYQPEQYGMGVNVEKQGNQLLFKVYNLSANPAKDAAMTFAAVRAAASTIYSRMAEAFVTPLTAPVEGETDRGVWARLYGSNADYAQDARYIGFTDWTYGVTLGADRVFHEHVLLGVWAGISTSSLNTDNGATTDADMQMAGFYVAIKTGRVHFAVDAMAGIQQSDTSRSEAAGTAYGYYKGDFVGTGAELGVQLVDWKTGTLKPVASLHYLDMSFKDQRETGPGAISMEDFSQQLLQSHLRLQVSQSFTMPHWGWPSMFDFAIGWRQNLTGNECDVTLEYVSSPGAPFTVSTSGYTRGCTTVGIGLRSAVSKKVTLGLAYDYEVAAGRQRHTLNGSVRWVW